MIFGWQRLRRAGQACNPGGNSFVAPQAGQVVLSTVTCWCALNPATMTKPQLPIVDIAVSPEQRSACARLLLVCFRREKGDLKDNAWHDRLSLYLVVPGS